MLLGFSHIGFTVPSMNDAVDYFKSFGFALDFMCEDLPNAQEKAAFLSAFYAKHDIAFMKGNINSVGVELILYPACLDKKIVPAFEVKIRGQTMGKSGRESPVGQIHCIPDETKTAIDTVIIESSDLDVSKKFWRDAAGFRIIAETLESLDFQPVVPVPNWLLTLRIVKANETNDNLRKLDVPGANLISIVATALDADKGKLLAGGGKNPSPGFSLVVNGRMLNICLIHSPEGQVVELIEFPGERGKQ